MFGSHVLQQKASSSLCWLPVMLTQNKVQGSVISGPGSRLPHCIQRRSRALTVPGVEQHIIAPSVQPVTPPASRIAPFRGVTEARAQGRDHLHATFFCSVPSSLGGACGRHNTMLHGCNISACILHHKIYSWLCRVFEPPTFKNTSDPVGLDFHNRHDSPKRLDVPYQSNRRLLQLRGEDVFV